MTPLYVPLQPQDRKQGCWTSPVSAIVNFYKRRWARVCPVSVNFIQVLQSEHPIGLNDVLRAASQSSGFISDFEIVDYENGPNKDNTCSAPELLWHHYKSMTAGFDDFILIRCLLVPPKQLFTFRDMGDATGVSPKFCEAVKAAIDSDNVVLLYLDRTELSEIKANGGVVPTHYLLVTGYEYSKGRRNTVNYSFVVKDPSEQDKEFEAAFALPESGEKQELRFQVFEERERRCACFSKSVPLTQVQLKPGRDT